jgi:NADH-quinone oxidoreductase subunit N
MEDLSLPKIDYAAIAPMLILFGVACLGVLFEAVLPTAARRSAQLVLALLGLVAALVVIVLESDTRVLTAGGAVAIDGPTLFLQGAIIVLGIMALLLIGDRALEHGGAFVAQAAVTVGSEADRRQAVKEQGATEVYPLSLFAIAGMLLFVAANDLLTMFVARWPAVAGCSARRPRSSTSCSARTRRRSSSSAWLSCTASRAASSSAPSTTR